MIRLAGGGAQESDDFDTLQKLNSQNDFEVWCGVDSSADYKGRAAVITLSVR